MPVTTDPDHLKDNGTHRILTGYGVNSLQRRLEHVEPGRSRPRPTSVTRVPRNGHRRPSSPLLPNDLCCQRRYV
jgi:hypothetical protein